MAKFVIVQGSMMKCNQGTIPTIPLQVTSQQCLTINGLAVATIMDHVPMLNIKPFGICQQLTKLAAGVPTPCIPATPAPWAPGASLVQKVNGLAVLTAPAKCLCAIGGEISIQQSDQQVEASD